MANTVNKDIKYWLEKIYGAITDNTAAVLAQNTLLEERIPEPVEEDPDDVIEEAPEG